MIDAMTRKRLHVSTDGGAGPYIMVPFSQLADVRQVLDHHGIRYAVEEDVISLDGRRRLPLLIWVARRTQMRFKQFWTPFPTPRFCHGSGGRDPGASGSRAG